MARKWLAVVALATMATVAIAADEGQANEALEEQAELGDEFRIGTSCAGLAYTSTESLRSLVRSAFGEELHAFCYPEEPFDCSDYTVYLKGLGTLLSGDDAYHCQLKLD